VPTGAATNNRDYDPIIRAVDELAADRARRGIRAWLLAPTLDLYHALMRGEDIPTDQLNPDAVKRYGIRRNRPAA
jgi:hypothetical protein